MVPYAYDEAGNRSAIIYPDGSMVRYAYDLNDNLVKVEDRYKEFLEKYGRGDMAEYIN